MAFREDPAEALLAEAPLDPGGRLLILEGGAGLLLDRFAAGRDEVVFHNSDYQDHKSAMARRDAMGAARVRCHLGDLPKPEGGPAEERWPDALELPAGSFDQVLYRLGKGTAALHGALWVAWDLLRTGGSLILAGHTREGVKSVAKRAEAHFGNAELLDLKSSCRLLRFRKSGPTPVKPLPDPEYFRPVALTLELPGTVPLPYLSKPGLFSYRATDTATALLARHLPDLAGLDTLDLGCGSGVLALAAFRRGAKDVLALDAQAPAIAVTRRNFAEAGLPGRVLCTHLTDGVEETFDCILTNPPFHEGNATDFDFPSRVLEAAGPRLRPGGWLLLVANQFLDYPAQAARRGMACALVAEEKGFRVYCLTP